MILEELKYNFELEKFTIAQGEFEDIEVDLIGQMKPSGFWGSGFEAVAVPVKILPALMQPEGEEWKSHISHILDKRAGSFFKQAHPFYLCLVADEVSPPVAHSLTDMAKPNCDIIVLDISHTELYGGTAPAGPAIKPIRELIKKILYKSLPYERASTRQSSNSTCPRCGKPTYQIIDQYSDILPPPPGTNWAPLPRQFVVWKCSFCGHSDREKV